MKFVAILAAVIAVVCSPVLAFTTQSRAVGQTVSLNINNSNDVSRLFQSKDSDDKTVKNSRFLNLFKNKRKIFAPLLLAFAVWQSPTNSAANARWYPRIVMKPRITAAEKKKLQAQLQRKQQFKSIVTGTGVVLAAGIAGNFIGRKMSSLDSKSKDSDNNDDNDESKRSKPKSEKNFDDVGSIGVPKKPNLEQIISSDSSDTDAPLLWRERLSQSQPKHSNKDDDDDKWTFDYSQGKDSASKEPSTSSSTYDDSYLEPLAEDDSDAPLLWREQLAEEKKRPSQPLPWERPIERGFNDVEVGDYAQFYEPSNDGERTTTSDSMDRKQSSSKQSQPSAKQPQPSDTKKSSSSSSNSNSNKDEEEELAEMKKPITMDDLEAEVVIPPLTAGMAAVAMPTPDLSPEIELLPEADDSKDDDISPDTNSTSSKSSPKLGGDGGGSSSGNGGDSSPKSQGGGTTTTTKESKSESSSESSASNSAPDAPKESPKASAKIETKMKEHSVNGSIKTSDKPKTVAVTSETCCTGAPVRQCPPAKSSSSSSSSGRVSGFFSSIMGKTLSPPASSAMSATATKNDETATTVVKELTPNHLLSISIKRRLNGHSSPLKQPRSEDEEAALKKKYASIESLEERAYQILLDLGMIEAHKSK